MRHANADILKAPPKKGLCFGSLLSGRARITWDNMSKSISVMSAFRSVS